MAEYLHSVLVQNTSVSASTVYPWDLPVNPISGILLTLLCDNDTGTIADYTLISAALAQLAKIEVQFKGQAIISMNGADLMFYSMMMRRKPIVQPDLVNTNDKARAIQWIIPFGNKLYDPAMCFPATRKGELKLEITLAAAQTGINDLAVQVETIELPEGKPESFFKATTMSKTPNATGDHDMDLPLGNKIKGIILWGTTQMDAILASILPSIGDVKLLKDNLEHYFAKTNWETLHAFSLAERFTQSLHGQAHGHWAPAAAADADTDDTEGYQNWPEAYAYLDFDPLDDGTYLLETEGAGRVWLRINAETANAIRMIPIEIMKVG